MNYWATWCPPCREEMRSFSNVSRRFSGSPVQFVGISIDRRESVKRYEAENAIPYPLLVGPPETLESTAALGNAAQALPFTVILDQRGEIRHVRLGVLQETDLEARIHALLAR
jgi:peroxiredoxin